MRTFLNFSTLGYVNGFVVYLWTSTQDCVRPTRKKFRLEESSNDTRQPFQLVCLLSPQKELVNEGKKNGKNPCESPERMISFTRISWISVKCEEWEGSSCKNGNCVRRRVESWATWDDKKINFCDFLTFSLDCGFSVIRWRLCFLCNFRQ